MKKVVLACIAVAIVAATVPVLSRGGGGAAGNWPQSGTAYWPEYAQSGVYDTDTTPVAAPVLAAPMYMMANPRMPRRVVIHKVHHKPKPRPIAPAISTVPPSNYGTPPSGVIPIPGPLPGTIQMTPLPKRSQAMNILPTGR
jgi:hypothetical protein